MTLLAALDGDLGDATITVDGISLRTSELRDRADRLAASLGGARAVAVPGAPSIGTVVAVVAAIRAGVPAVPVRAEAGGRTARGTGALRRVTEDFRPPEVSLSLPPSILGRFG